MNVNGRDRVPSGEMNVVVLILYFSDGEMGDLCGRHSDRDVVLILYFSDGEMGDLCGRNSDREGVLYVEVCDGCW